MSKTNSAIKLTRPLHVPSHVTFVNLTHEKNLPGSTIRIIESEKVNHCKPEPTPAELITYCQAYINGLKKEINNGDGEEWMHNHIHMEEAIVNLLKNIPAKEIDGMKGCDEVSPIKPLFKSRADLPLQNNNAESDGRSGSHPSRCCGRCNGTDDICVADRVCEDHQITGCEICFGLRSGRVNN